MNQAVEQTGKTVDEAIEAALQELGMNRDEVEVDIIQMESAGIFGLFGRKDARVRVHPVGGSSAPVEQEQKKPAGQPSRPSQKQRRPQSESTPAPKQKTQAPKSAAPADSEDSEKSKPAQKQGSRRPERSEATRELPPAEASQLGQEAADHLVAITKYFGLELEVQSDVGPRAINIKARGQEIGQLIGRRGRTLNTVQFVISRLVNEDRSDKRKVRIDVDGYNETHEQSLRDLARKSIERVMESGRPYCLRSMPPQDRRVIHLESQNHAKVATESQGDEGRRFVILYPRDMDQKELESFLANARPGGSSGGRRQGNRGGGGGRRRRRPSSAPDRE